MAPYDPTLDLAQYVYPTAELLDEQGSERAQVSVEELEANKDKIVETLGHYGISIASIKATIGPTVTLYEIIPEAGIRISKIKSLEDDIALSLAALGIRIIAPIPGKGTIG
ncbi:MAG: DNA translocase FtsK, partial [Cytophagales bacterium]|nr:DNA translocase FtsK [Cytophagales bacterium]